MDNADIQAEPREVVVRKYGLLAPLDWADDCEDELRKRTALWNRLVEIEREYRQALIALTADDPFVSKSEEELAAAIEARRTLLNERKMARKRARAKIETSDIDHRLKALSTTISALGIETKRLRKAIRENLKGPIKALEDRRYAAVKAARQNSGLFWPNYNSVVASYERARHRSFIKKSQLRFHCYDGSGQLTNQIQGGMSTEDLFTGRKSQARIQPPDSRRRTILTVTVYTRDGERRNVTWPMIMHRPIPDDCRIKEVVVTRQRIECHWRWSVVFTCTRSGVSVPGTQLNTIAAIDLGWRRIPEGVRVATVLMSGDQRPSHIILPQAILDGFSHVEGLRSQRDQMLNEILKVIRNLDWASAPPSLSAIGQAIIQAPKIGFGRVAALAIAWRKHAEGNSNLDLRKISRMIWDRGQDIVRGMVFRQFWCADAYISVESWRQADKRAWLEEVNLRDKLMARRRDFYRNEAKKIAETAGKIILEDFDIAKSMKVDRDDGRENPIPLPSRRYQRLACGHELRKWIILQAAKTGAEIIRHKGKSTWPCHICGEVVQPDHPENLIQLCSNGHIWDQDENACRNMLVAHGASAPATPNPRGALAAE